MKENACRICGAKTVTFERTLYKILQVVPVHDMLAVFADEDGSLYTCPIYFLALAEVTPCKTTYHDDVSKGSWHIQEEHGEIYQDVVGLDLAGGQFDICNDLENFAGLCRVGDDPDDAIAYLPCTGAYEKAWHGAYQRSQAKREKPQGDLNHA